MTNEPRLTFSKGQDILSYISHALGYWPADSLVCITMSGNILGATLRTNLLQPRPDAGARGRSDQTDRPSPPGQPAQPAPADLARYVREILRYLAADQAADGVLLAVFGSADWEEPARRPHARMVAAIEAALAGSGRPVKHSWYVGPGHWRSYYCTDPDCCGWPGRPVSEITDSALNAELIFRGSTYESGPQMLARDAAEPLPDEVRSKIATAAAVALQQLAGRACRDTQFRAILEVWESAVSAGSGMPDDATSGYLLASLESVTVRDSVLVLCSVGPQLALEGAALCGLLSPSAGAVVRPPGWSLSPDELAGVRARFSAEADCPADDFGPVLVGQGRSRPDWGRISKASDLLVHLARGGSGDGRAAALTMLAWLQWCRGRGSAADSYLDLALAASPQYRLAVLLQGLLGMGSVCGWARDRSTAWNPTPEEAA